MHMSLQLSLLQFFLNFLAPQWGLNLHNFFRNHKYGHLGQPISESLGRGDICILFLKERKKKSIDFKPKNMMLIHFFSQLPGPTMGLKAYDNLFNQWSESSRLICIMFSGFLYQYTMKFNGHFIIRNIKKHQKWNVSINIIGVFPEFASCFALKCPTKKEQFAQKHEKNDFKSCS